MGLFMQSVLVGGTELLEYEIGDAFTDADASESMYAISTTFQNTVDVQNELMSTPKSSPTSASKLSLFVTVGRVTRVNVRR
jgi:hypothetical protein